MRKISLLLTIAGALILASCANDPTALWSGEGYLSLGFTDDPKATIMKSEQPEIVYKVTILDDEGAIAASYPDHSKVPEKIKLKAGRYLVQATNGADGDAGFETPYYKGEQVVNVASGKNSNVEISCKLANVAVSVAYADVVKDNFNKYVVTVTNESGGSLVFDEEESRIGYFKNSGKLTWTINLANKNGSEFNMVRTIREVKPREHYTLNFVIDPDGDDGLDVEYDEDLQEQKHNIDLILNKKAKPLISGAGFDASKNIQISLGNEANAKLDINAAGGVYYLAVRHNSPTLQGVGLPTFFNIFDLSDVEKKLVNDLGIMWTEPLGGAIIANIDLSGMTERLPIGSYELKVQLIDHHAQMVEQKLNMVVADVDVKTDDVNAWAKFVKFKGSWNSPAKPEGIGFMYKKVADADWIEIPESELEIEGKSFKVTVKDLEPDTEYEMRSFSAKADGAIVEFTTEKMHMVPNLSFDSWYQSGKSWYANANSSSFYWDSGNDGANTLSAVNPTAPEDSYRAIASGRAVKLETKTVFGVLAAGSIYTGKFGRVIGTSGAELNFGRPYAGRPLRMTGYYDYRPKTVDKGNQNGMSGKTDQCHIYIILTDWNNPFAVNTSDKKFIDVANDPGIIAYGEFSTDQNSGNRYLPFTIDINYRDLTRKPKHVVIVASSSRYGDYFTGGEGSVLYIDELNLEFDPK